MAGVALPGALGFAHSVREAWRRHRGIPLEQQGWLAALVVSTAANGPRIGRVFLVCGLFYFWGKLAKRTREVARHLMMRWGEVVLEVGGGGGARVAAGRGVQ